MKRSELVIAGAEQLRETENAVDLALSEAGELMSTLTRLRVTSGLSGVWGQRAVMAIIKGSAALAEARAEFIEAHGHLYDIKVGLGCKTVATGNDLDKPENDDDKKVSADGAAIIRDHSLSA